MDLSSYVEGWAKRLHAEDADRERLTIALKANAQRAAQALERMGVKRVILFGSVARACPRATSDIDLAIEGLDAAQFWKACRVAEESADFEVDVFRMEEVSERFRKVILRDGEVLFER